MVFALCFSGLDLVKKTISRMGSDTLDLPPEAKLAVNEGNIVELVEGECDGEDGMSGEEMGEMGADAASVLVVLCWSGAGGAERLTRDGRELGIRWTCCCKLLVRCEIQTSGGRFDRSQGGRAMSWRVRHDVGMRKASG